MCLPMDHTNIQLEFYWAGGAGVTHSHKGQKLPNIRLLGVSLQRHLADTCWNWQKCSGSKVWFWGEFRSNLANFHTRTSKLIDSVNHICENPGYSFQVFRMSIKKVTSKFASDLFSSHITKTSPTQWRYCIWGWQTFPGTEGSLPWHGIWRKN